LIRVLKKCLLCDNAMSGSDASSTTSSSGFFFFSL
jgi:hypothetical protein